MPGGAGGIRGAGFRDDAARARAVTAELHDGERAKLIAFANAVLDMMEAWLAAQGINRRAAGILASDGTSPADANPACAALGLCSACGQIHPPTDNHVNGGTLSGAADNG